MIYSTLIILGGFVIYKIISDYLKNKREREEEDAMMPQSYQNDAVAQINAAAYEEAQNQHEETQSLAGGGAESTPRIGSFEIMSKTLNNIGCQPDIKKNGIINVKYQGENFQIECSGPYARIWDPMWAGINADDPNLSKFREAVNAANFYCGPTVVMTDPNDDGVIGLHSRYDIMLDPSFRDTDAYVRASLDIFFETKEHVREQYSKLQAKQVDSGKKRRPVGFTPENDPE